MPDMVEAAGSDDVLEARRALRDLAATVLSGVDDPREFAAVGRLLNDTLDRIVADESRVGPSQKGTPLDELEARRAARKPRAASR